MIVGAIHNRDAHILAFEFFRGFQAPEPGADNNDLRLTRCWLRHRDNVMRTEKEARIFC